MAQPSPTEARGEVLLLGGLGAFLIFVQGIVEIASGSSVVAVFGPGPAGLIAAAGVAGLVIAFAMGALCILYDVRPERGGTYGAGLVIAAAFSLWLGGGFVVGFVLGLVAGVLAIVLPPTLPEPSSQARTDGSGPDRAHAADARSASPGARGVASEAPVVRYCPACWEVNDPASARCRACGAELPHTGEPAGGPATGGAGDDRGGRESPNP